ncbi:MAG TPA: formate dehydrogenase accessory protein FdhE, partial [Acetobacteraceae bacterium]|nr:formate dehydrogenase accessory protein FdhE [Acetobacteraceae bacterium]
MPNNPPPGSEKTAAPVPSMEPGFVRLPDPASLFRARAVRLSELAIGHRLAPYLTFLAALARIQENLAASALPPAALAPEGAPLNRSRFVPAEPERALADAFLAALAGVAMPEPAAAALRRVRQSDAASRTAALKQALATPAPTEALPEHALLCAALQIAFSRRAAGLAPETLSPGPAGSCPICASPRSPRSSSAGRAPAAPAIAPAASADASGSIPASPARSAARPRASTITGSMAMPARSRPRAARPAAATSRSCTSSRIPRWSRSPTTSPPSAS